MINLTLQQLFGAKAKQDSHLLVIQKSDLQKLTPLANNRAEQLLVAILLQASVEFEGLLVDETGEAVVDESKNTIKYDQRELYEKLHLWFWKRQFARGRVLDTFIVDVFVNPPTSKGILLNASQL